MRVKPDRYVLGGLAILLAMVCAIALTWLAAVQVGRSEWRDASARASAHVVDQALVIAEQINRQILVLDQTLRVLADRWQADPQHFDLETARRQAAALAGLSRDMLLVDRDGIVRQSSVPEATGRNLADAAFFRALAEREPGEDRLFIGATTINPVMRQWHMDVARPLRLADGSFAGAIVTDYRTSAITDMAGGLHLDPNTLVSVIGLADGKLRAALGPSAIQPDASITGTPMFTAIGKGSNGLWTGPSALDAIRRIHAYRRLPGRDLAVVVAASEQVVMAPAMRQRLEIDAFAGFATLLLAGMAVTLIRYGRQVRRRELALAEERAVLAAANAQLQVARAHADAKTEQLEATLAGMTDGVAMVSAHFCLVEWNARFPEIAGIPAESLRVGLPMEEILRMQARNGQFGALATDQAVEAEVQRRMAALRTNRFGVTQRERPDGRSLELRRNRLPDGGFVTLYSDVTDHKRAEADLKEARAQAEAANQAKSRFVAIVSHEIRTPLNALLNTIRLLADMVMAPAQRSLVDMARQSGDALSGLINDILEMSHMEAGDLTLRPSLFSLRPLLEGAVEMFRSQAAERGIRMHAIIADGVPAECWTDPGRLRQILLNLLSNAAKFAAPGNVALIASPGDSPNWALRLVVRDTGPVIQAEDRARLFQPFSRLERPGTESTGGTGLGLAICRQLIGLMGGEIGCESWVSEDGTEGNSFWITLPPSIVPAGITQTPAPLPVTVRPSHIPRRNIPRTRILLVEDIAANQVVTATLLRREGHLVDIVGKGEDAVRAIRTHPYDIAFMDIFMPGMSGPEATQRIRALRGAASRVPIVALTANVSASDETLFREAGMDGILGKPVALADLLQSLARHAWAGHPANVPAEPVAPPAADEVEREPVLSGQRIAELRSNLAPDTFAALVEECLVDLDHRLPALRRALLNGAGGAIAAQAHAMVGMAAGYGMVALEARLRTIMAATRNGDPAINGKVEVGAVEVEMAKAAAALRGMLQNEPV